jgi:hypothetical protein
MFGPISVPFGAKMLFNTVKLKAGVSMDDVELALGDMCNVVKDTYGGDKGGFIAGQVFRFSGFVSDEAPTPRVARATTTIRDRHVLAVVRSTSDRTRTRRSRSSRCRTMCTDTRTLLRCLRRAGGEA